MQINGAIIDLPTILLVFVLAAVFVGIFGCK